MRSLNVTSNDRLVGVLSEQDNLWQFRYDEQWAGDPAAFDLSPYLPREDRLIVDGGTLRPVQWYFDNLLPEEDLRTALSKEAKITDADAFALLEYLGAESAGSLVLLRPDASPPPASGTQLLSDAELSQRIKNLPHATLNKNAPKRMSVAGAQHKLLLIYEGSMLFEPIGPTRSTHILKPNHPGTDYACSVINEYAMMKLARSLGLSVPEVYRRYCPEPVCIVQRFDRQIHGALPRGAADTTRWHLVDACQLLNKDRLYKYTQASLQTLQDVIAKCRNRLSARLALFNWLTFNLLIGNNDNHIKNISFLINHEGVRLAPFYDLLSTAAYRTKGCSAVTPGWPVDLAIALPGQPQFKDVTREGLISAGMALGLTRKICEREMGNMIDAIGPRLDQLINTIRQENTHLREDSRPYLGGEMALLRTIRFVIVAEMGNRLK